MVDWPPRLVFTILPCLVGAYAAAVYLTARPISATRAWTLGVLIATLLTFAAVTVMGPWNRVWMDRSVFLWYGSLYFIPTIVLVPTALGLRGRRVSRGVGVVVLIILFLATAGIGRYVALGGAVNAVQ
jgi:hypothetical protein